MKHGAGPSLIPTNGRCAYARLFYSTMLLLFMCCADKRKIRHDHLVLQSTSMTNSPERLSALEERSIMLLVYFSLVSPNDGKVVALNPVEGKVNEEMDASKSLVTNKLEKQSAIRIKQEKKVTCGPSVLCVSLVFRECLF